MAKAAQTMQRRGSGRPSRQDAALFAGRSSDRTGDTLLQAAAPVYLQIAQHLRARIQSGKLDVGDQLPTESEIMATFGVGRHTVRNAVQQLEIDGLIKRFSGRGTFVAEKPQADNAWAISSLETLLDQHYPGNPKLLGVRWMTTARGRHIGDDHALWQADRFLRIRMLRQLAGDPVSLAVIDVPERFATAIPDELAHHIAGAPLLRVIEEANGTRAMKVRQITSATEAPPDVAKLLKVAEGAVLFTLTNTFCDGDGAPLEAARIYFRPDAYAHTVELFRADS